MTKVDVELVKNLTPKEYSEKIAAFEELLPELTSYINAEANKKSMKLPTTHVDRDDLIRLGETQVWIATLRHDPERGSSLKNYARRLIWTNMAVALDDLYQQKRTARTTISREYVDDRVDEHMDNMTTKEKAALHSRVERSGNALSLFSEAKQRLMVAKDLGLSVTLQTASLFDEVEEGVSILETIEDPSTDPLGNLIATELYDSVMNELLARGKRKAAGVLRYMIHPDQELVRLCEKEAQDKRDELGEKNSRNAYTYFSVTKGAKIEF